MKSLLLIVVGVALAVCWVHEAVAQRPTLPSRFAELRAFLQKHSDLAALEKSDNANIRILASWLDDKFEPFPSVIVVKSRTEEGATSHVELVFVKNLRIRTVSTADGILVTVRDGAQAKADDHSIRLAKKTDAANPVPVDQVVPLNSLAAVREAFSSATSMKDTRVVTQRKDGLYLQPLADYFNMEGEVRGAEIVEDEAKANPGDEQVYSCKIESPQYRVQLLWRGQRVQIQDIQIANP
jgi:hypothetical protein